MNRISEIAMIAMAVLFLPGLVLGVPVDVTITGNVVFNEIDDPPLSGVNPGDSVVQPPSPDFLWPGRWPRLTVLST